MHKNEYYIVDREALPEVYGQVVEAKRLLASGKADTVQEAVDMVGISRSSFYKYKDMIEPFTDMVRRKTVTIAAKLEDMPGVLPKFLLVLEEAGVNILTIHQAIPTGGIASITLSVEIQPETEDTESMMKHLEDVEGIHYLKILGFE